MSNLRSRFFIILFILSSLFSLLSSPVAAQVSICDYFPPCATFKRPSDLVNAIVPAIISIAGIVFFILLIVAGFQVIMHAGSGDAKELARWKSTLSAAIIGFLIIVASFWVIQIIQKTTGIRVPGF